MFQLKIEESLMFELSRKIVNSVSTIKSWIKKVNFENDEKIFYILIFLGMSSMLITSFYYAYKMINYSERTQKVAIGLFNFFYLIFCGYAINFSLKNKSIDLQNTDLNDFSRPEFLSAFILDFLPLLGFYAMIRFSITHHKIITKYLRVLGFIMTFYLIFDNIPLGFQIFFFFICGLLIFSI